MSSPVAAETHVNKHKTLASFRLPEVVDLIYIPILRIDSGSLIY
jgi:hypothetical protein